MRNDEAKRKGGYYEFRILFVGNFEELVAFLAAAREDDQRNIAIALLEEFSKSRIGYNPQFEAIRQRVPNIDDFSNPFKVFVAGHMLGAFKEEALLR